MCIFMNRGARSGRDLKAVQERWLLKGKTTYNILFMGRWFREIYNVQELSDAGVVAYKCFMATCGSDLPGDFKNVDDYTLYEG